MAPQPKGSITPETLGDGTLAFRLRFRAYGRRRTTYLHERRDCECVYRCGGGWNERTAKWSWTNILACVKAGVWQPPKRPSNERKPVDTGSPLFVPYGAEWLQDKIDGVNGEKPITKARRRTIAGGSSATSCPSSTRYRLDEIDRELCSGVQGSPAQSSPGSYARRSPPAPTSATSADQKIVPLSASSVRKVIDTLASILEEAVEDEHIDSNPARGKRMRVHVPKPKRTFLEMDELAGADRRRRRAGHLA